LLSPIFNRPLPKFFLFDDNLSRQNKADKIQPDLILLATT